MAKIDLSLILACYNEGPTFAQSVLRIVEALKKLKVNWEIIFVEDKSSDDTLDEIKSLARKVKNSKLLIHNKNHGRGKSVSDGIRAAKGEICGYLDVDLEISENYIPIFVDEIKKGYDMVVGKRYFEAGYKSLARFLASKIYSFLVKASIRIPISDTEAGYKFFKRDRILPVLFKVRDNHWFWDTEICAKAYWMGLTISEIPVLFVRRRDKKSTVRLIPDTIDYIKNLIRLKSQITNSKFQTNLKSKIINSKQF
ncbi:hypothetical protein A3D81_01285 [Candidatus Curtissbacteria bacterium RIFCSPHIGHO2_02_FULL_40_17]|uniref:Glycosyltransferase 2-like domain-containing protein n=4 Tax=Candidatus Curtissiibacteriota TaxID=1752717 RepID=A0A1F5GHT3_9BACT|nr:MAG: hypothetical protein A2693_00525 [Candidatus Curtissbacteria bacterium RIFCSPHIGHO2_01_FULL_40_12]OGD91414.1 MAG: hypothetical protein A3D81_01285 [Candidatus Curtissbacteria bacterium RIFCSPHIGHO2_02_FULL_40_17]OGE04070.1 MAG: hypothetical protein A3F45_02970 [Candidatus Curtissbacteria bacterium RIFCSPHIGHO2_12_FULL_41_17]OGE08623.1 MAG: hypothetical protein A3I53_02540 [Candidatus Curtissbacteria bacterium RIFCSPLOWO2_02_FULL_40_13b]